MKIQQNFTGNWGSEKDGEGHNFFFFKPDLQRDQNDKCNSSFLFTNTYSNICEECFYEPKMACS